MTEGGIWKHRLQGSQGRFAVWELEKRELGKCEDTERVREEGGEGVSYRRPAWQGEGEGTWIGLQRGAIFGVVLVAGGILRA